MSETKLPRPCKCRASSLRCSLTPTPCAGIRRPDQKKRQELSVAAPTWRSDNCRAYSRRPGTRGWNQPGTSARTRNQLEVRVLGRQLVVGLERRLVASVHDRTRKLPQPYAGRYQAPQRLGVAGIVLRHHQQRLLVGRGLQRRLVELRQGLPLLEVDDQ